MTAFGESRYVPLDWVRHVCMHFAAYVGLTWRYFNKYGMWMIMSVVTWHDLHLGVGGILPPLPTTERAHKCTILGLRETDMEIFQ
jgi:hypothetical protein